MSMTRLLGVPPKYGFPFCLNIIVTFKKIRSPFFASIPFLQCMSVVVSLLSFLLSSPHETPNLLDM